jgi:PBP1b-binding outer membrane lipoprotein LpoB
MKMLISVILLAAFLGGCDNKEDASKKDSDAQNDSQRSYEWPHKKTINPDYTKY